MIYIDFGRGGGDHKIKIKIKIKHELSNDYKREGGREIGLVIVIVSLLF